jgi:two-component system alkaline phosphatase synthesis response regulator PhoP
MELMARVEALLRRAGKVAAAPDDYAFGNINVNFKRMEADKAGQPLDLSPREYRLLQHFIAHRGEVVSRNELLDHVWGYNSIPLSRTVDMHIAKLRQKIEDTPADPAYIVTVHRVGYKFVG